MPGVGKKSALRLALHLVKQGREYTDDFTSALQNLIQHIKTCEKCHNLSDEKICSICADPRRDKKTICVVENIRDVMAIEDTSQYRGSYHVLGGTISPIEGVGPEALNIDSLTARISAENVKEIIMAISPTIEGETTIYFISKKLKSLDVKVSTIARGVSFGGDLEYADELTLGRSILARVPYRTNDE